MSASKVRPLLDATDKADFMQRRAGCAAITYPQIQSGKGSLRVSRTRLRVVGFAILIVFEG